MNTLRKILPKLNTFLTETYIELINNKVYYRKYRINNRDLWKESEKPLHSSGIEQAHNNTNNNNVSI